MQRDDLLATADYFYIWMIVHWSECGLLCVGENLLGKFLAYEIEGFMKR